MYTVVRSGRHLWLVLRPDGTINSIWGFKRNAARRARQLNQQEGRA